MDSCGDSPGPDHSWLTFSLSNQNNYHHSPSPPPPPPHHQLCLFQPPPSPFPSSSTSPGDNSGANCHQHQHDLSFMGGGEILQVGLFPTVQMEATTIVGGGGMGYDTAEMKSLAVEFLGGFSSNGQQQQEGYIIRDDHNSNNYNQSALVTTSVARVAGNNKKKIVDGFGHRTSIYRGVTRHRWTGRYEAHLWDNSCRREGQSRKGRQVYLGGYDKEDKAARAYDLAALKYWGPTTTTNFPISDYERELEEMKNMSRQEFVASLRRKSSGFSRGASIYRGVTRHHQHGRWQARIGRVAGNKDLYLGTFSTQEEAAEAYDIAAIKFRGLNAVTNFDISRYDVKSIISSNLPVGGMSNKSKLGSDPSSSDEARAIDGPKSDNHELPFVPSHHQPSTPTPTSTINFTLPIKPDPWTQRYDWPAPPGYEFLGTDSEYVQQPLGGSGSEGNNSINEGYDGYEIGNSNNNNSNWTVTSPNLHSFQSPKPNLTVVQQTPIFGIE